MSQLHIKLDVLYQPFVRKLEQLVEACNKRNALYIATSGLRTFQEQNVLFEIGRTTGRIGHTVTKARGGQSPHNYGIAADFSYVTSLNPVKIDDAEHNYRVLSEEAAALGLVSGLTWDSDFVDPNHVQWPVKQIGYTWDDLKLAYRQGGYQAIYSLLDKWQVMHGQI